MKKITFLLIALFLGFLAQAQLYQVPYCNGTISSNTYGPMNSVAGANATSRTAVIYPSSQLSGIFAQTLTSIYFSRMTATGTMGGAPNFKIYLKETANADFGAGALDWATEIATATLVYDSNPATETGSSSGWKSFALSTNFVYSGTQNLAVYMEYVNTAASTTIGWEYEYSNPCIVTTNSNTTKYINNTTGTPGASLTSTNYRRPHIGFDYLVSCPGITGLGHDNLTATTVDLDWTPGGGESIWEYVIQPTADPAPTSGTQILTDAVVGATVLPNTPYTAYVRADCGGGDFSVWSTIEFTTPCATYSVPALENFSTYVPGCWQEADNGDLTAGPSTFGTSSWAADGFGNVGTTGAMRVTLDGAADNDWILSPLYAIPATGYELKFFAAANQSGSVNAPTTAWESDDYVEVLVSTGTSNWTELYTYDDLNVPSNTGSINIIDLDAYAGQTVRFAYRAVEGASNGSASIDFSVDNFEIRLTPACDLPSSLGADNITFNSADLNWTAGGAESLWNIEWGPSGFTQGTGTVVNGVANPHPLGGLTPNTNYQYYVQADCGANGTSVWAGPYSFYTGYCLPSGTLATSYINSFETTGVAGVNITNAATGFSTNNYGDYYATHTVSRAANQTINFNAVVVGTTVGCAIWVDWNNNLVFESSERMFNTTSYSGSPVSNSFVVPNGTPDGDYRMRVLIDFNMSNPTNSCGYNLGRGEAEDYKLTVDATLSSSDFDVASFRAYPNPVKDVLNLSYSTEISSIEVFNMLGQKVITKELNLSQGQVDMSNLTSGNYMVKVTADGQTKTIKVVKQ
ncbi:GEVED domain-containing protein [Flavobacterium sp.]|uniref:GEVED domain-containing protein n=1 Tax=Flavobacterium sp. TaxID=239 RepID=UPI0028BEF00C|nr:GEVED domain-containing protein [Flavobacterium sp.]